MSKKKLINQTVAPLFSCSKDVVFSVCSIVDYPMLCFSQVILDVVHHQSGLFKSVLIKECIVLLKSSKELILIVRSSNLAKL